MKEIPLTQDKVTLVDDSDFEWLNQWKWTLHKSKDSNIQYAKRCEMKNGKYVTISMHREIMCFPNNKIDHIDGNGLNNQRFNLRKATHSENLCNHKKQVNNISGYYGVSWCKKTSNWLYQKQKFGKHYYGRCSKKIDAIIKSDKLAVKLHGEFASLNFSAFLPLYKAEALLNA